MWIHVKYGCAKFGCKSASGYGHLGKTTQRPCILYHYTNILMLYFTTSLPLLFIRSSLQRWPNKPGKNVHPYVHTSVHLYVRTSTMKHNAATNQIVVFVKVDETFTTIWLPRSSEVKVKVRRWPQSPFGTIFNLLGKTVVLIPQLNLNSIWSHNWMLKCSLYSLSLHAAIQSLLCCDETGITMLKRSFNACGNTASLRLRHQNNQFKVQWIFN